MAEDSASKTPDLKDHAGRDVVTPPKTPTVGSMSPEYPKHRDALIVVVSIIILIVLVAGGYFLVQGGSISLPKITQEPARFFRGLLGGGDTSGICSKFIRTHRDLFKDLDGQLQWSLVSQEIQVINNDKSARLVFEVKGNRMGGFVYFLLRKHGDTWRISSVAMKTGEGKFERLYPGKRYKDSNI